MRTPAFRDIIPPMKSLIILILVAVLVGGSYLSKPSEKDFREMIKKKMEGQKDDMLTMILSKGSSDRFCDSCTYKDRFLWLTVEHEGKTIYTGAFNSWFASDFKIEKNPN